MSELITTKQLCEWLKISENTAYNWRKKEMLPFIQLTSRNIKYDMDAVKKWLEGKGKGF